MKFTYLTPGVLLLAVGTLLLQIIFLFWEAASVHIFSSSAMQVLLMVQLCVVARQGLVSVEGGCTHGWRS